MRSRPLAGALVALSVAGLVIGARAGTWEVAPPLSNIVLSEPRDSSPEAAIRVDSLRELAVARDPFRVTRQPAKVTYDPVAVAHRTVPAPPKPALILTGIVWDGTGTAAAVLEGLPSVPGARVVRLGEVVGPLRVQRIEKDRVVVVGLDTAWTLKVREPWR